MSNDGNFKCSFVMEGIGAIVVFCILVFIYLIVGLALLPITIIKNIMKGRNR